RKRRVLRAGGRGRAARGGVRVARTAGALCPSVVHGLDRTGGGPGRGAGTLALPQRVLGPGARHGEPRVVERIGGGRSGARRRGGLVLARYGGGVRDLLLHVRGRALSCSSQGRANVLRARAVARRAIRAGPPRD